MTTIGLESVVAPNINVVKKGVQIGSITKLGSKSCGVLVIRNLSQSSALPIVTTRVFGIPQMMFINVIRNTHWIEEFFIPLKIF
jgi:hypothetical protein